MSSGANIGDGGPDGIGDNPTDLGVWEKFQLGWLQPQGNNGPFDEVARAGQKSTHKVGPNTPATKLPRRSSSYYLRRTSRSSWVPRPTAPPSSGRRPGTTSTPA